MGMVMRMYKQWQWRRGNLLPLVYLPVVVLSSFGGGAGSSLGFSVRASTSSEPTSKVRMSESEMQRPPVAKKVEHKMEMFGDVRVDNYYWLRDDSRSDPQVLSYLQQENDYTQFLMSGIN